MHFLLPAKLPYVLHIRSLTIKNLHNSSFADDIVNFTAAERKGRSQCLSILFSK